MTEITIKFPEPENSYEAAKLIAIVFCPAFYMVESDTIVLTKKITIEPFAEQFLEIIAHEYLHAVLQKEIGQEAAEKLDNVEFEAWEVLDQIVPFLWGEK